MEKILQEAIQTPLFSVEEVEGFMKRLDEKYTIDASINLFEKMEFGAEQAWFESFKKELREMTQDNPNLLDRVIGPFNTLQCISLTMPRVCHLLKASIIFFLMDLRKSYPKLEKFSQLDEMTDSKVIKSKTSTISVASFKLLALNRSNIVARGVWSTDENPPKTCFDPITGERIIDPDYWSQFMSFIKTRKDVISPPQDSGCIIC